MTPGKRGLVSGLHGEKIMPVFANVDKEIIYLLSRI